MGSNTDFDLSPGSTLSFTKMSSCVSPTACAVNKSLLVDLAANLPDEMFITDFDEEVRDANGCDFLLTPEERQPRLLFFS